jgi:4'-phosphopantetheinyl transferase
MSADNAAEQLWQVPREGISLPDDEAHVWRAKLARPQSEITDFWGTLTPDEQERAARFHFDIDREHFIAARGMLRAILSRYLATPPEKIRFGYGPYGKPFLLAPDRDIRFNLSHSSGVGLFAVTRGRELGIDLERIRDEITEEQIAERFFSSSEVTALRALPAGLKVAGFFNCWTRKEAYIKATGKGLSLPLDQFDVSLTPGEPAELLQSRIDAQEALRWSMAELLLESDFKAALVVEGSGWLLRCWQWPE